VFAHRKPKYPKKIFQQLIFPHFTSNFKANEVESGHRQLESMILDAVVASFRRRFPSGAFEVADDLDFQNTK